MQILWPKWSALCRSSPAPAARSSSWHWRSICASTPAQAGRSSLPAGVSMGALSGKRHMRFERFAVRAPVMTGSGTTLVVSRCCGTVKAVSIVVAERRRAFRALRRLGKNGSGRASVALLAFCLPTVSCCLPAENCPFRKPARTGCSHGMASPKNFPRGRRRTAHCPAGRVHHQAADQKVHNPT